MEKKRKQEERSEEGEQRTIEERRELVRRGEKVGG